MCKKRRLAVRSLIKAALLAIYLSVLGLFFYSPIASASEYSCGSYGAGSYQTAECPKRGIFAPLTGISAPVLGVLALAATGGGVSLFLATKRGQNNREFSDR